ncbi:ATP-grasp domain-containing protein [Solibacillus sp. FSL H8-0538]|uniref:ATP-grasp domain-containing protein n=1 Tax=Solibacillus sp. FSL H8-0538 TaxID=2921400 RepID=UPI0030FADF13
MKKIMILGASLLQLPAILKAKEMGLQVVAVDMDKNAIGFNNADVSLQISTTDIPKVVEAAKRFQIDGVMTLASDLPMRTVAAVAEELNIIGISKETALKATNKAIMRECLQEFNVPIPVFYRVDRYDEYLKSVQQVGGKCIVKPADNSGSRGVFLINDMNDQELVEYAFEYSKKFSNSGEIVVEEYMVGAEVSVETLSVGGKVHIIAITDKLTTGAPRFVEMGHSQPSCLSENIKKQIEEVTNAAVMALGIKEGPSHTEIIVTTEGPKVVEIGARLGGDNITTHLVPLSTGVDMVKCCIEIALGRKPELESKINLGSAIRYFETHYGKLISISGVDQARQNASVQQISFVKNVGDDICEINSSSDRVGFIITQAIDAFTAINNCEMAKNLIKFQIGS